jgi:CheY-like chemotaxis protein
MFKTVLIIDDFQLEYEITKQILLNNRFAEHVICIDSAMDALLYLCTAQPFPEVIFLDVNMPKKMVLIFWIATRVFLKMQGSIAVSSCYQAPTLRRISSG